MAIRFSKQNVKFNLKNKRKIVNWIKEIAESHNITTGEISIIFVSDSDILEINKQYLNHNYFTDIITFDYSSKRTIEGDIFISVDTVNTNSVIFKSTFNEEILRVIIHGVLHLIGFKDKSDKEQKSMRMNEDLALEVFHKRNDK